LISEPRQRGSSERRDYVIARIEQWVRGDTTSTLYQPERDLPGLALNQPFDAHPHHVTTCHYRLPS
jgi:endonuclease YncB( thermonuclease family)